LRVRWSVPLVGLLALFMPVASLGSGGIPAAGPASFIDDATLQTLGFRGGAAPGEPAGDWMLRQRAGEDGTLDPNAYARALRQARKVARFTAEVAPGVAEATWESEGPNNIGGRVAEVAVDPTQGQTCVGQICSGAVFAATASGGVWRSLDGGVTWHRRWPNDLTQSMGAIAVGGDGTIYAGTGEPNPGGGSIVYGGTGVYTSKDDGATWQFSGLPTSGAIGRIVPHPTDDKTVYVASAGNLFTPGGERGLYRTTDGGATWTRLLAGDNDTTGAADVAVDPANPNNILVGMWDHVRLPTHRVYAGVGSGVFRSTDGGATWARMTLPGAPAANQWGRIGVALAPSDPSRAYALIANNLAGSGVGLWRSDDGGATWAKTAAPANGTGASGVNGLSQSSYGWWFGKVWVDPLNADRVFVAGLELVESVDGGDRFFPHGNSTAMVVTGANQAYPHADQHGMVWDPLVPGRVYLANDGGIYISDANATVGSWRAAVTQGWTQHYSVDVSEQNPNRIVSGLQDNMCQRNYVPGDVQGTSAWNKYGLCGDGLQTLVKPTNQQIIYGCAQYGGNCSRTLDDGTAFEFLGSFDGGRAGWWVPMLFDPTDPEVMYAGTNVVSRSTDGGLSWAAISPDLTTNPTQLDPNPGYRIFGTITTISVSKTDPGIIQAGTDDGLLWRTEDGGANWERLTDHDNGNEDETDDDDIPDDLWVTSATVDPSDAEVVYASFSGFRGGSNAPHVVLSRDGGFIWDDISGNLPDAPVVDLIVAGDRVIVGTDVGVYMTTDDGQTWLRLGSNLPAVPVLDLRYHAGTNTLTVSTFGHGIQRVMLPA